MTKGVQLICTGGAVGGYGMRNPLQTLVTCCLKLHIIHNNSDYDTTYGSPTAVPETYRSLEDHCKRGATWRLEGPIYIANLVGDVIVKLGSFPRQGGVGDSPHSSSIETQKGSQTLSKIGLFI